MITHKTIDAAIANLRAHRITFEPGLSDDEIGRIERMLGFHFPPDMALLLKAALPVSGGFPNWRSESEINLRGFIARPSQEVLNDVRWNDFWIDGWGPRPGSGERAASEAARHLASAALMIPVRSRHYIPAIPFAPANPVFSIRQSEIRCLSHDLMSYLMNAFDDPDFDPAAATKIPVWTDAASKNRIAVPTAADVSPADRDHECKELCRYLEARGFWTETDDSKRISCDRQREGNRRHGAFWLSTWGSGWMLFCVWPYYLPDTDRIFELCLALLNRLPYGDLDPNRPPWCDCEIDDATRRKFGLVSMTRDNWTREEFEYRERSFEAFGWRTMSDGQMCEALDQFEERVGWYRNDFRPLIPSITWDSSWIGMADHQLAELDLTAKALESLTKCTRPGEELLALDLNHPCYFFDPHGGVRGDQDSTWAVSILPHGAMHAFVAKDFSFGTIGNCVENSLCVFGQKLIDAIGEYPPRKFGRILRRDSVPFDGH